MQRTDPPKKDEVTLTQRGTGASQSCGSTSPELSEISSSSKGQDHRTFPKCCPKFHIKSWQIFQIQTRKLQILNTERGPLTATLRTSSVVWVYQDFILQFSAMLFRNIHTLLKMVKNLEYFTKSIFLLCNPFY